MKHGKSFKISASLILILFMLLFLPVSLSACSKAANEEASNDVAKKSSEPKKIIVGISPDYPPYDTLDTKGNLDGFDVEMTKWLFDYLNNNGYNVELEWRQMSFDTIISAIQTGQVDFGISGFTYDEDRKVLFSEPYYIEYQVALVKADTDISEVELTTEGVTKYLEGKSIAVQMGSAAEEAAQLIAEAEVKSISDNSIVVESVKTGAVDAAIMGKAVADSYAATGDYIVLQGEIKDKDLEGSLNTSDNFIIAAEGEEELMKMMNEAIVAFKASEDYKACVNKWFGD